jgi:hypothetical protein
MTLPSSRIAVPWQCGSAGRILKVDSRGDTMSRRTGSRARLKAARRRAKNPDVKKKTPTDRSASPSFATAPAR